MPTLDILRAVALGLVTLIASSTPVCAVIDQADLALPASRMELVFPNQYRETPGIIDAITRQPLLVELRIQKAELLSVYDATEPPLEHRQSNAKAIAGSHAENALEGTSKSIMIWGPYAKLEEGHYAVVYRFKLAAAPAPNGTIFLDVCHNACTRSGLRLDAGKLAADKWQEVAVPVYLPEAKTLEFRFWPGGNLSAVDRVYVFKVTPKPPMPNDPAAEELLLGEAVPGRGDVVTSPHTEDDGKIDISGLPKGAKVRCPYTGNYFRVP